MTRVSVLVPAYNRHDLLRKTLDSIMARDTDGYEVIIVDDSPTDLVERVVREHPLQTKIRYERNPKRLGQAQNCKRAAEGKSEKHRWRNFFRATYDLAPDWFKNVTRTIRRKTGIS